MISVKTTTMGTYVLYEQTFSCQAGNYPFEGVTPI